MKQKIEELLHEAMKKGDKFKVTLYRCLKADIETAEKNGKCDVMDILNKAVKKRMEARDAYLKAGREDEATAEKAEANLIRQFLPKEPTELEVDRVIMIARQTFGSNMGMIIKDVKSKFPTIDGKSLATKVKAAING